MPPELRILESELLYRIRQRIHDGRLPMANAPSVSAGYAAGTEVCVVCDQQIASDHVSYEITDPAAMIFHRECYMIWQRECAQCIADAARKRKETHPPARKADTAGDTDAPDQPPEP